MKSEKSKTQKPQRERFIEMAKELGATSEAVFDAALKRIGSAKVVAGKPKAKPSKKSR